MARKVITVNPLEDFKLGPLIGFFVLFIGAMLLMYGCTNVPVGSGVVEFNRFTHNFGITRGAGLSWINPITSSKVGYVTRTETLHFTRDNQREGPENPITVLSDDALGLSIDISVQYHLDRENLVALHDQIGPEYRVKILIPAVRETVRDTFAKYEATEAATSARNQIKMEIESTLSPMLAKSYITLEQVLIREVQLPEQVIQAINSKKAAQQDAEKMQYVLQKSEQEKEQVKIEAMAQAERIAIIDEALARNPNYLNWLAIDTLNDKVNLIISDGKTILNLDAMRAEGTTN